MNVYLAKKNGTVISHTDLAAMEQIDGISVPDMTISGEEWEDAGSVAHIDEFGKIVPGKTGAEKQAELDRSELERIKAEIGARDYRALKAFKLGEDLDSLYPGESEWYASALGRVHELEEALG
jgi:hypothetical protein